MGGPIRKWVARLGSDGRGPPAVLAFGSPPTYPISHNPPTDSSQPIPIPQRIATSPPTPPHPPTTSHPPRHTHFTPPVPSPSHPILSFPTLFLNLTCVHPPHYVYTPTTPNTRAPRLTSSRAPYGLRASRGHVSVFGRGRLWFIEALRAGRTNQHMNESWRSAGRAAFMQ